MHDSTFPGDPYPVFDDGDLAADEAAYTAERDRLDELDERLRDRFEGFADPFSIAFDDGGYRAVTGD